MEIQYKIIEFLMQGMNQGEISAELKGQGIRPNSLSFIEKSINSMKAKHNARTMFQLGAILSRKERSRKKLVQTRKVSSGSYEEV